MPRAEHGMSHERQEEPEKQLSAVTDGSSGAVHLRYKTAFFIGMRMLAALKI